MAEKLLDETNQAAEVAGTSPTETGGQEPIAAVAPTGEETPTAEVIDAGTDPEGGQSVKNQLIALIGNLFPDVETSTDDGIMAGALQVISRLKKIHDGIYQVAEEFPDFAEALVAMIDGMDPNEAIHRYMDLESMTPPEGAPDFEKIKAAKEARRQSLSEREAFTKKYNDNQQVSLDNLKAYMQDKGLSQEQAMALLDKLTAFENDLYDGMLSPEHIDAFAKGFMYDTDIASKDQEVQDSYEDGRVAGLNEKIGKEFKKPVAGDGLPNLRSTAQQTQTKVNKKMALPEKKEFKV